MVKWGPVVVGFILAIILGNLFGSDVDVDSELFKTVCRTAFA